MPFRRLGRSPGSIHVAAVTACYLLLTLLFTYPLLLHFTDAIPGDGFDGWQNYWNLWWIKTALLVDHTHPFFTSALYWPTGVSLLFHTLNAFNGFLTLPIQLAGGLFPAYNVAVLFSFVAGAVGAWLLALQLLGAGSQRGLPAFTAGVIYAFAPVHIAHLLGHLQVLSLEWIPFYALYLLRLVGFDPKGAGAPGIEPRRGHQVRNAALAAVFLALIAFCDWYFVLYCAILTAVVLAWAGWRSLRGGWLSHFLRSVASAVLCAWLAFAALLSPLLVPMVREATRSRFMVPDPAQSRTLSADLLAFITPQEFHPLWGSWASQRAATFTASLSEHQVFAGFTVLILAALGIRAGWDRRKARTLPGSRQDLGPWPLAWAVFFVLALGPVLHVAGQTRLLPGGGEIYLPYQWLVKAIPFVEITRSVSRFDVMVMLVMALLAAAGLLWIVQRRISSPWMGPVLLTTILFEFLPIPYPLTQADTPAYYRTLANDPRPGAVLNLPMNWDRPGYLLYQTVHGKPLAVAYISRDDPRTLVDRIPVLQELRHLGPDVVAYDPAVQGAQMLSDLGVRWVILDRYKMPGDRERTYNEQTAHLIFGERAPVYKDQRITVYEVPPSARTTPYLILGDGWGPLDPDRRERTFTGSASLIVQAPTRGRMRLQVTLSPTSQPLAGLQGDGGDSLFLDLNQGANEITLRARDAGSRVVVTGLALTPVPGS